MTYEMEINKARDGWEARSEAEIGQTPEGQRILKLRTSKIRGGIATCASVCIRKGREGYAVETYALFEDFYKPEVVSVPCKRVTSNAVRDVHSRALHEMDNLIEQAKAFYAEKESQAA